MSGGKDSGTEHGQDFFLQNQKPQGVCHGGSGSADPVGTFFLGQGEGFDQCPDSLGFIDGIQVFPLQVFGQGHDGGFFVVSIQHDGGNLGQVSKLGGPPSAFAGDDHVAIVAQRAQGDGGNDTVLTDTFGQGGDGFVVKELAGLVAVGFDSGQTDGGHLGRLHGFLESVGDA